MFDFDYRTPESPLVELIWRTHTGSAAIPAFISSAATPWELVFTRQAGQTTCHIRGPETRATPAPVPLDAEIMGIVFKPGTYLPHLPVSRLVNQALALPEAADRSFWLYGSAWEIPTFEQADTFIHRLIRAGWLVRDPVVAAVLRQEPVYLSPRSIQRRFLHATGLTQKMIQQIERARLAAALLEQGTSILDVVGCTGYVDQAHLTNALKRLIGQTPAQLIREPVVNAVAPFSPEIVPLIIPA